MRKLKDTRSIQRGLFQGRLVQQTLILFFLWLFTIGWAHAQEPGFRNISVLDGLPSARVFQVRAGADGTMWFATDNGVANFDGNTIHSYGEEEGLTESSVFALTHDNRNREWFATYTGELFFHEGDSLKAYKNNEVLKDYIRNGTIISLSVYEDTVWVSYNMFPPVKVYGDGELEVYDIEKDQGAYTIYQVKFPHSESIFGRLSGRDSDTVILARSDAQGNLSKEKIRVEGNGYGYPMSIQDMPNGDVLVTMHQVLLVKKRDGSCLEKNLGVSFSMASSAYDPHGRVWIGTFDDGVFVLDPKQNYAVVDHFLIGHTITSVTFDREGGAWLSSYSSGVFYSPLPDIRYFIPGGPEIGSPLIRILSHKNRIYTAAKNGDIYQLANKNGFAEYFELWVESEQGIIDLSSDGHHFYIQSNLNELREIQETGEEQKIYQRKARYILADQDRIYSIASHSSDNGIWMKKPGKGPVMVSRDVCRARDVKIDREKNIWLACQDGIQILTLQGDREMKRDHIPVGRVKSLFIDKDTVYAATSSRGVAIIDRKTLGVDFLDKENGLRSNQVHSGFVSSDGALWVSTNIGLHRLRKQGRKFEQVKVYTEKDGLLAGVINGFTEADGQIWCLGDQGIWKIPLKGQHKNETPPLISITASELVRDRIFEASDLQQLRYQDNSLSFRFRGVAFRNGEEIRYRYRLIGLDSNYRYTKEQQVFYSGLASGAYTFEVQAANNDGVWSESPATIHFTIPQPWWETWWFFLITGVLSLLIVYWAATFRNRIRNQRNTMQPAMIESEQKALSSQINPHFLYNSLNSAQFYINSNKSDKASDHLANFSMLMRKVLQNTSNSFVSVKEELSILKLYLELEQERFENKFEFSFDVDEVLNQEKLQIPSMILQPHVENAIWHGLMKSEKRDGHIKISLKQKGNTLIWSIKDNGIGRAKAAEYNNEHRSATHVSSGLRLTRDRLELLSKKTKKNYKLEVIDLMTEDLQPAGTEIVIQIPVDEIATA